MKDFETIAPDALSEVTGGKLADFLAKAQKILGFVEQGYGFIHNIIGSFKGAGGKAGAPAQQQAAPEGGEGQ